MRLVKLGIISIFVFFILLSIIGSLFPSDILIARSIQINSPKDTVASYITDLNKWNDWMEGAKTSDLKVFAKDSTHAIFGTTVMTLINHTDSSWQYEWKNGGSVQVTTIVITSRGMGSDVQWEYKQHLPWYPWAKLASVMNDKIIGSSLETNLTNLKKAAEHQPQQ